MLKNAAATKRAQIQNVKPPPPPL